MEPIKVVRGYYLTGLGQEELVYYFKIDNENSAYETLKVGDVAVTFYQNREAITGLPALIRVDGIIDTERAVSEFLRSEKKDHIPMLPIVGIYEGFDPLQFNLLMTVFENLKTEIRQLAPVTYIQGDLFEMMGGEE